MRNFVSAVALLGFCSFGVAATFTVNTTSDLASQNCTGGACSLRGALNAANATTAEDTIAFNIPQADPGYQAATQHWRINVGSTDLPGVEEAVVIDGYTQPGAVANTLTPTQGGLNSVLKIEIKGDVNTSLVAFNLLGYTAALPSVFRGMVINGFQVSQILLSGSVAHRIEGCYIGTDVLGQTAMPGSVGVNVGPGRTNYQIGGLLAAQRNLIASPQSSAINGFNQSGFAQEYLDLVIQGNLIGLNRQGTAALINLNPTAPALSFLKPLRNALIGGNVPNARNVISGYSAGAIRLDSLADEVGNVNTRIEGNYIGTDVTGSIAIGNGFANPPLPIPTPTISVTGVICDFSIGGSAAGQANLIAYSAGTAIVVNKCTGVQMGFNRFLANRGGAVDLTLDAVAVGATANDVNDVDEGGNRLQNYPELTLPAAGSNNLMYRVDTDPANGKYPMTVNFYRAGCDGGSASFITSTTISAAQAQQVLILDTTALGNIRPLTATAVDDADNTSEFAPTQGEPIMRSGFENALAPLVPGTCR